MNDNAKQWVAALRSGEYSQTQRHLRDNQGYCCLGVACNLFREATGQGTWKIVGERHKMDDCGKMYMFEVNGLGRLGGLHDEVMAWLGVRDMYSRYIDDSLINQNDQGVDFQTIADIIESEPQGLFRHEQASDE